MLDRAFDGVGQKQLTPFTLLECAEFCSNIYSTTAAPAGWTLINIQDDPISGFRAACYGRNLLTQTAQIAFVYRGTVLNFPDVVEDLINDIKIMMDKAPGLSDRAVQFFFDTLNNYIHSLYQPNTDALQYLTFITTGHSLGAILSHMLSCALHKIQWPMVSVTFENPGSFDMVKQRTSDMSPGDQASVIARMQGNCTVYQAGVNLINSTNAQTGAVYRIGDLDYKYSTLTEYILMEDRFRKLDNYFDNFVYCVDNTPYEHGIANIVNYIAKNNPLTPIKSPPNLQAGYIEFMNPANNKYWTGYFNAVWHSDSEAALNARIAFTLEDYIAHGIGLITDIYNRISKQDQKMSNSRFILFNVEKAIEDFTIVDKPKETEQNNTRCSIM